MAELVDVQDLGSCGAIRVGSTPTTRTIDWTLTTIGVQFFCAKVHRSLVYKGRKVALYGGAYAPSYLPNDVDTFACGVNCGNHQIHHPPLIVKVHFFPCVQIAGNFFDLFRADGIHT